MQGAFNLHPPVYTIIAGRLGQGNFSRPRPVFFVQIGGSRRAAAQHHARVYAPSQTRRLEICTFKVAI